MVDPNIIPIVLLIVFAVIVKILSDNKIRRVAIDKGLVNENLKFLYQDRLEAYVPSSLKWGMVLIGIGLAIFIGQLLPPDLSEKVTIGAMLFLAGVGLVIYYFIANRLMKKRKEESTGE